MNKKEFEEWLDIEVELFKIGDSETAVNFNVVAKPNGWSKNVKKQVSDDEITETKSRQLEYWTAFRDFVSAQPKPPIRAQKPLPQNWTNFAIGRSDFHISATVNSKTLTVNVQLWIEGDNAKAHYDEIYEKGYEESKVKISPEIQWQRLDERKTSVVTVTHEGDFRKVSDWPNQFDWLYQMIIKGILGIQYIYYIILIILMKLKLLFHLVY